MGSKQGEEGRKEQLTTAHVRAICLISSILSSFLPSSPCFEPILTWLLDFSKVPTTNQPTNQSQNVFPGYCSCFWRGRRHVCFSDGRSAGSRRLRVSSRG